MLRENLVPLIDNEPLVDGFEWIVRYPFQQGEGKFDPRKKVENYSCNEPLHYDLSRSGHPCPV